MRICIGGPYLSEGDRQQLSGGTDFVICRDIPGPTLLLPAHSSAKKEGLGTSLVNHVMGYRFNLLISLTLGKLTVFLHPNSTLTDSYLASLYGKG